MPDNRPWLNLWMRFSTGLDQLAERAVLSVGIDMGVCALEFNPNAEIVAPFPPAPTRQPGMPGVFCGGDKLNHLAVSTNQEVCGYGSLGYLS